MNKSAETKKYMPLVGAAGIGSMLGSGIIIGLSATINSSMAVRTWNLPMDRSESSQEHLHLQSQQDHCLQEILQSYSD